MLSGIYRVLLSRETEGVKPHRMQHVEALHSLKTRIDISRGVTERMSDVEP